MTEYQPLGLRQKLALERTNVRRRTISIPCDDSPIPEQDPAGEDQRDYFNQQIGGEFSLSQIHRDKTNFVFAPQDADVTISDITNRRIFSVNGDGLALYGARKVDKLFLAQLNIFPVRNLRVPKYTSSNEWVERVEGLGDIKGLVNYLRIGPYSGESEAPCTLEFKRTGDGNSEVPYSVKSKRYYGPERPDFVAESEISRQNYVSLCSTGDELILDGKTSDVKFNLHIDQSHPFALEMIGMLKSTKVTLKGQRLLEFCSKFIQTLELDDATERAANSLVRDKNGSSLTILDYLCTPIVRYKHQNRAGEGAPGFIFEETDRDRCFMLLDAARRTGVPIINYGADLSKISDEFILGKRTFPIRNVHDLRFFHAALHYNYAAIEQFFDIGEDIDSPFRVPMSSVELAYDWRDVSLSDIAQGIDAVDSFLTDAEADLVTDGELPQTSTSTLNNLIRSRATSKIIFESRCEGEERDWVIRQDSIRDGDMIDLVFLSKRDVEEFMNKNSMSRNLRGRPVGIYGARVSYLQGRDEFSIYVNPWPEKGARSTKKKKRWGRQIT